MVLSGLKLRANLRTAVQVPTLNETAKDPISKRPKRGMGKWELEFRVARCGLSSTTTVNLPTRMSGMHHPARLTTTAVVQTNLLE